MYKLKKVAPILVLLLAFFLQMQYLAELRLNFPDSFGQQPFCGVDAVAHTERAAGLLDGTIPGEKPFYFIPLYPLYLLFIKELLGDSSLLLPIFIQAQLQLVGIAALYGMGRLLYSASTGILAALGLATYSYYLFYLPCFDQAMLTVPFLTLAVFFLLKYYAQQSQKPGWLLAAGLVFAPTVLSRPTVLAIFPVLIIWLYFDNRSHNTDRFHHLIRNITLLILPFLIIVSPITWHNYQTTGRFILLSNNFDVNLFTGNNPDAAGLDSLAQAQSQPAVIRFKETNERVIKGETTLTVEVLQYITTHPTDWLKLTARKTWLWFGEVDERLVSPFFPLSVRQSSVLSPLPVEWQAMMITALIGLLFVPVRRKIGLLWLIYGIFSAVTILFFIQLRFRLPFAPFVMLSAALLLTNAPRLRQKYPRRFWTALVMLLLLYPVVPGLWLPALIFAIYGLPRRRLLVPFLCLYLLTVGLWTQSNNITAAGQTIDHYLGTPLAGSSILGQNFRVACNGLNRIDVTLGLFDRPHDQPVIFKLMDWDTREIIYSETFDGGTVKDYQQRAFYFTPIPDSEGRGFFFMLESPTSTPKNGITARGYADTPFDRYPSGSAWAGQMKSLQQFQADVAFTVYCEMSLKDKLWRVVRPRRTNAKPARSEELPIK